MSSSGKLSVTALLQECRVDVAALVAVFRMEAKHRADLAAIFVLNMMCLEMVFLNGCELAGCAREQVIAREQTLRPPARAPTNPPTVAESSNR